MTTIATHTIDLTASYYDPEGIPPRCRKPQPTYFTVRTPLEIQEVAEADLTLAARVKRYHGGFDEYYTVAGREGFFILAGVAKELLDVDYSLGGSFANQTEQQKLDAFDAQMGGKGFFGLDQSRTYYHDVKIADAQLAKAYTGASGEHLLILATYGAGTFHPQGNPTDEQALEYLRFRASNLLIAGDYVYKRVAEPMVRVELNETTHNAPHIRHRPWDSGYRDKLEVKLSLVAPTYLPNPAAGKSQKETLFDYQLQPLTAVDALVEQFTAETMGLEGALAEDEAHVQEDYRKQVEALGVTVHNPEAFSPAVPVPARKVRAARHNLAVGVDELRNHYGADWESGKAGPMKAADLKNLLEVMAQAKATLEESGEALFLSRERLVEVAVS